jgi:nicotinamidase-related amidase
MADLPTNAALIIVDVQKGFDDPRWGRRNNPQAESNIKRLLEAWRKSHMPVFYIQHCSKVPESPLRPGTAGNEIKDIVAPLSEEPVVKKNVNSAFIGTDLEPQLRRKGIETLVITGITTDHCVSTTARMGGNMGFDVYVVSDATSTFDRVGPDGTTYRAEVIHEVNLASLHNEFATVVNTDNILERLRSMNRSASPNKRMQSPA